MFKKAMFGISFLLLSLLLVIPCFAHAQAAELNVIWLGKDYIPWHEKDVYFSEGLFPMLKLSESKYGYIDKNGQVAIPFVYDYAEPFSDGVANVEKDGEFGYIDKSGKFQQGNSPVLDSGSSEYKRRKTSPEGLDAVKKNDKWGYVDENNQEIIPFIYDDADSFREGLAVVKKDGKWGYIDRNGKVVIDFIYDYAYAFYSSSEGLAYVVKDDKYGYIDKTGKVIIDLIYDDAENFYEDMAAVSKDDKWGYIDKTGKVIIGFIYDEAGIFHENIAIVGKDVKKGYIDKTGKVITDFIYDYAGAFYEDIASVSKNDKWGYIDKTGKEIIPCIYDQIGNFSNKREVSLVEKDGKYGLMNKNGQVVIDFIYDDTNYFSDNNFAMVKKDGKWGGINGNGQEIISCTYDLGTVYPFHDGVALIEKDQCGILQEPLVQSSATSTTEPAQTNETATPVATNTSSIKVNLDGQAMSFEQEPLLQDGRVMLPVRAVFEALGAAVNWDGATQTVTAVKGDKTIEMTVGNTSAKINGKNSVLDVAPLNISGRTLVPLRFVAESLDCEVSWDGSNKSVNIISQ